eukprot:scaffold51318_cov18-Tisochrysis_lutea.AAC.1
MVPSQVALMQRFIRRAHCRWRVQCKEIVAVKAVRARRAGMPPSCEHPRAQEHIRKVAVISGKVWKPFGRNVHRSSFIQT